MNRNFFFKLFIIFSIMTLSACGDKEHLVTIHTEFGDIKLVLFDDTPQHKENFLRLAHGGRYDSTNFHRVIEQFMIQGGDINAKPGNKDSVNYTIPAEIREGYFHQKGAVAAARMGDNVNPERESSGSQFYIIHGKTFSPKEIEQLEENRNLNNLFKKFSVMIGWTKYAELRKEYNRLRMANDMEAAKQKIIEYKPVIEKELGAVEEYHYSEKQKEIYAEKGGAPHLDGEYTVFGQVVDGYEVIDMIAAQPTDGRDKPTQPIYMTVSIEEVAKKEIEKLYGYQFPEEK
jgi:peptidyl-prolyl cis-trans isomerase B (cyclophilin B)